MRVRSVGAHALLLEVDDPPGWFAELWQRRVSGHLVATEIVPGATTVLLDGVADPAATSQLIRTWTPASPRAGQDDARHPREPDDRRVTVPVTYDGPDLPDVARFWHTSTQGVIERLNHTELRVAFCGFAPGWAYLTGLPADLAVPRLDTPRTKIPAGSVALADSYAGIYPNDSPGGWRVVGHTAVRLFDADRDPPAILTPGTRVSLTEVSP